jgi:hypothetical protein
MIWDVSFGLTQGSPTVCYIARLKGTIFQKGGALDVKPVSLILRILL